MPHWELAEKHIDNLDKMYKNHRQNFDNLNELNDIIKNNIITMNNDFKKILSYEEFKSDIAAQHVFMKWIYYNVLNVYFNNVKLNEFENIMLYVYDVYKPEAFNYKDKIKNKTI